MDEIMKNAYDIIGLLTFLKNALFSSNSAPHIGADIV
jgi:hypothetical protein